MRLPIKEMFDRAYGHYGLGAYNIFNAEQVHGVFMGARRANAPVILQITTVSRDYMNAHFLEGMIAAAEIVYPDVDFTVHLDHGNYQHCVDAINSGYYQSVMIDASKESFSENIRLTKQIVQFAHAKGIAVESELGVLKGVEGNVSSTHSMYTNPEDVVEFVEKTGCDSLAVAVGTSHGAYKFSGGEGLQIDILEEIQRLLPGYPLVLHGASSVPTEEVRRIQDAGGNINASAKGVDDRELLLAIKHGVVKINIATDMRLIWTRVHREFFRDEPEKFDMVVPGKKYMEALELFVAAKSMLLMRDCSK